MNDSIFDPASFLNEQIQGQFETEYTPVPENDYQAQCSDVVPREVDTKNGKKIVVDFTFDLQSPDISELMGTDTPKLRYTIWLDQTEDGALAQGINKNLALGQMLSLAGLDKPDTPWSFSNFVGVKALAHVEQSLYKDKTTGKTRPISNITALATL